MKYPVYVISKGRFNNCLTAIFLIRDQVNFNLVVEPQEYDNYAQQFNSQYCTILTLPFSNLGKGSMPARNWVWDHAKQAGAKRHWILDDNIRQLRRMYQFKRIACKAHYAFQAVEDFTDRYENIGISGLNYTMFAQTKGIPHKAPFFLNCHVYSCLLILNELPFRWRMKYNEDTDLCLQTLAYNYCTVAFNAFMQDKLRTMTMKGGNTDQLYAADGRLKMARSLEAMWPQYVKVIWRFGRPQHSVNWRAFKKPLIRRKDIDWDNLKPNNYGMKLVKQKEIKSPRLQAMYNKANK